MRWTPLAAALVLSTSLCSCNASTKLAAKPVMPHKRPPVAERTFISPAVDTAIEVLSKRAWKNPDLAVLLSNCLPNTLDTTVLRHVVNDTFIITGDIHAMWLRDSLNQVVPYFRFAKQDPHLGAMLAGLLRRQAHSVLLDPHANAFTLVLDDSYPSGNAGDDTTKPVALNKPSDRVNAMTMAIFERKFELDSLMAFLKMSRLTCASVSAGECLRPEWISAVDLVLATLRQEQKPLGPRNASAAIYQFQRKTSEPTDTLSHKIGYPHRYTGMIRCAFRPSDDAVTYPYLVPANAMAVVELRAVAPLLASAGRQDLATEALSLAQEISDGISKYGILQHPITQQRVFAYEVDGLGNAYFADDANIPSLLSMPYLGYVKSDDEVYLSTRSLILSEANPWYFQGSAGSGIGGPHVGIGYIWPMSLMVEAYTSKDTTVIAHLLENLNMSSASTGFMHESFFLDQVRHYTRPWFAWANSLFGELLLTIAEESPQLLFSDSEALTSTPYVDILGQGVHLV